MDSSMQGDEGAADVTDGEELDEDPSESGYVTAYYETDGDVESDYFSGDGLADLEYCNDGYSAELTGKEPYELLREKRKVGRYMEEQYRSVRDMDELGDQESEIAQAEADAIARGQEKYKDRRSAKRKAGHGRRSGRRKPTRVSRGLLPPEGDRLLQQANLALVKGDSAHAVKQIMECIREYPNFTEPYMFLAATYEILKQPQNSVHCYAIALHMKPSDRNIAFECATKSEGIFSNYALHYSVTAMIPVHLTVKQPCRQRILETGDLGLDMAIQATHSMLKSFPNDPFAAQKMAWFQYKTGNTASAIESLQQFIEENPDKIEPTHNNMMAQLLMEAGRYSEVVELLEKTMGLESCKQFPDLCAKVAACKIRCGDIASGIAFAAVLYDPVGDDAAYAVYNAVDIHDLYLEVAQALSYSEALAEGLSMFQEYVNSFRAALEAASIEAGEANDGDALDGIMQPAASEAAATAQLLQQFLEMLPAIASCSTDSGNMALAIQAYDLVKAHVSPDELQYTELMLQYVELLLASPNTSHHEIARELMSELNTQDSTTDANVLRDIDTKVKLAEGWLQAGNEAEFTACIENLLESSVRLDEEAKAVGEKALRDVDPAVRRRVFHLIKHPAQLATLQQARKAVAEGGSDVLDASGARRDHEDQFTVLQPSVALSSSQQFKKDRRKGNVKDLDKYALAMIEERKDEIQGIPVSTTKRTDRLLEHPVLFPMLLQVLNQKMQQGDFQWAQKHSGALLGSFQKASPSRQQLCNRAQLQLLSFSARIQMGRPGPITGAEQKRIFSGWPYSIDAWSLFSRWCHEQGSMRVRMVSRILDKHPTSLPLLMLRGHCQLITGQYPGALKNYFEVFELLPEDPVVNMCIAVGYLLHSTTRAVGDRNSCILKAFAFFSRYATRRGHPAEAAYNMGRAFHHLELHHLAEEWYERSLVLAMAEEREGSQPAGSDLRFECAHNLALIYEASGARQLAIRVRWHHCSV